MIPPKIETYPVRQFQKRVAWLLALIVALVILGLLSHRKVSDRAAWKSSPYGESRDTGAMKAGR